MILVDNYVLVQFLGICPFLGVSKRLDSAVGKMCIRDSSMALSPFRGCAASIFCPQHTAFPPVLQADRLCPKHRKTQTQYGSGFL